jgi:CheY-like chemotaxis protein
MGRPSPQDVRSASPPREAAATHAVLVVDDDPRILETTGLLLRHLDLQVHEAATGAGALTIARRQKLDLALLDQRLPDMSGLDVAKTFRRDGISVPWILMSGFMDFEIAAEAGRLGAVCAVSLPFDVEEVVTRALAKIGSCGALQWPTPPLRPRLREARSAAERWARFVLLACDVEEDPSTTGVWASAVGAGHSTLREACNIVGVRAHDARDFMRVLRILVRNDGRFDELEGNLKFSDGRTLETLLEHAGLSGRVSCLVSVDEFLAAQRFISIDRPLMKALRKLIAELQTGESSKL